MSAWFDPEKGDGPRPVGRPLLALSDIRGDRAALESILDELRDVELCGVVAAGDHCLGGPDPFGVWQRLQQLGATLVRGATDLALGVLPVDGVTPRDREQEQRLAEFMRTRAALGDIVCRRLADLPSTAVVSLDDRSGVMVVHGSPRDDHRGLSPALDDDQLAEATGCVAEDVLVSGCTQRGFVRQLPGLLVVHAGSVSRNRCGTGARTAHGVLLQPFSDGVVRASPRDVPVRERAADPSVPLRIARV
jgi:hypothetical protein